MKMSDYRGALGVVIGFTAVLFTACESAPEKKVDEAAQCTAQCAASGMEVFTVVMNAPYRTGFCTCRPKQLERDCSKEWERSYDALAMFASCRRELLTCKAALPQEQP